MSDKYILDGKTPVPCSDLRTWAMFFEDQEKRRVAKTEIGDYFISTVFLGIDHKFSRDGEPLLFETMIFGGIFQQSDEEYQTRCSTWEQAERMHSAAIRYVKEFCLA